MSLVSVSCHSGHIQSVTSHFIICPIIRPISQSCQSVNQSFNNSINCVQSTFQLTTTVDCPTAFISGQNQVNLVSDLLVQHIHTALHVRTRARFLARFHLISARTIVVHVVQPGQHSPQQKHNTIPVPHAHPPKGHRTHSAHPIRKRPAHIRSPGFIARRG